MSVLGEPSPPVRFSTTGRITITVLLLVLPVACLLLALTEGNGWGSAWYLIAALNLVLPAVILPVVWREPRDPAASEDTPTPQQIRS